MIELPKYRDDLAEMNDFCKEAFNSEEFKDFKVKFGNLATMTIDPSKINTMEG